MKQMVLYEKSTNSKVLYVRHGQTEFNKQTPIMGSDIVQAYPDFVDAGLNSEGIASIQNAKEQLLSLEIDTIYCSPFLRTLQTAYHIFENHPKRDSFIIIIHPYCSEKINGVHDYCFDISSKKKQFNMESKVKFSWELFDSLYKTPIEQEFYVFNFCVLPNETFTNWLKELKELFIKGDKEQMKIIYGKMGHELLQLKMNTFETFPHTFKRCVVFKRILLEKIVKDGSKDEINKKIVVITHSAYCKMSTSVEAYTNTDDMKVLPKDSYFPSNGEIISMGISDDICMKDETIDITL